MSTHFGAFWNESGGTNLFYVQMRILMFAECAENWKVQCGKMLSEVFFILFFFYLCDFARYVLDVSWWSIPQKGTCIGHFGARNDPTIRISNFFDEMRLSRSLRLLRLLRLLRSLRLLRFLMRRKSSNNQSASIFWFFEAKEAVEVIEASDVIVSVEAIEATEVFKTI